MEEKTTDSEALPETTASESLLDSSGKNTEKGEETAAEGNEKQVEMGKAVEGADNDNVPTGLAPGDLVVPDGKTYDEELGKSFLDIVNDEKISRKELAQKLLDMYSAQQDKMVAAMAAANQAAVAADMELTKKWAADSIADPEFGGVNWKTSQTAIAMGRDQIATPEAVAIIKEMKLDNHPEILRMFYRAGKLLGEDGLSAGKGGKEPVDIADAIYGESVNRLKKGDNN